MKDTEDIGRFAAEAFMQPDKFKNAAVTLAGDELSQGQADVVFTKVVGKHMPMAPCPVASTVKFFLKGAVGDSFRWFEEEGYGGDVEECRRSYDSMQDFQAWIEKNKRYWAY